MNDTIEILVNGKRLRMPAGSSAAAAIMVASEDQIRISVGGQPRSALCGMGVCMECRATVDGRPHQRTCQIEVRPGMESHTNVQ
jgi:hypothetical protein